MSFQGYNFAMRSWLSLAVLFAVLPAFAQSGASTSASDPFGKDEIVSQEESFWTYYVSGNSTELEKLILPDFFGIAKKVLSRDDVLAEMNRLHQTCTLSPVTPSNPQVAILSHDVATISYSATVSKTCDEKTIKSDKNITAVWVRRDGRWQMHIHTEYTASEVSLQSQ